MRFYYPKSHRLRLEEFALFEKNEHRKVHVINSIQGDVPLENHISHFGRILRVLTDAILLPKIASVKTRRIRPK